MWLETKTGRLNTLKLKFEFYVCVLRAEINMIKSPFWLAGECNFFLKNCPKYRVSISVELTKVLVTVELKKKG